MSTEVLLRAIGALGIIVAGLVAYWLVNRLTLARAGSRIGPDGPQRPGRSAIVYFTTPTCVPCATIQRPALDRLKERLGERLDVREVDASARPDLAKEWGVWSVPTTFVLDASGRSRYVNHGVASTEKLLRQVEGTLN